MDSWTWGSNINVVEGCTSASALAVVLAAKMGN